MSLTSVFPQQGASSLVPHFERFFAFPLLRLVGLCHFTLALIFLRALSFSLLFLDDFVATFYWLLCCFWNELKRFPFKMVKLNRLILQRK